MKLTRSIALLLCFLVLAVWQAGAQSTFANFFATVNAPGNFPFPLSFHATRVIAIYDTNHNGFIDSANRPTNEPFPVAFENLGGPGSWIGSPKIMAAPTSDLAQLAQRGKFCGDILIYAEQVDQAHNIAYFIWFAVQDPNQPPKPAPCNAHFPVDFGIGSYQGSYDSPFNVRHASFFGGQEGGTSLGEVHMSLGRPGTPASPGHIYSTSGDPTAAWPATFFDSFVAAEVYATGFDPEGNPGNFTRIPVSLISIDVPLIGEDHWDGRSFFATAYPIAESIQPIAPSPTTLSASLWSPAMAGSGTAFNPDQYKSVHFVDVNGDGKADLCYRDDSLNGGIRCGLSTGTGFAAPTLWTSGFGSSWSANQYYWGTIQFGDLNGDGKMDVCGRGAAGIYCAVSNGGSFGPVTLWSSIFSDANGWASDPSYWQTIRLVDVNGDGKADICGRGTAGIYCALSNGASFGPVTLWSSQYSNSNNWNSDPSYWSTIQFADLNGDGRADVCGRGGAGLVCATSNGSSFVNVAVWTTQFRDSDGWKLPQYYSTIRFADIDGDGRADVCGRGGDGFYCGLSTDGSFAGTQALQAPAFSDANGWNLPQYYGSIYLADVNGDGNADICGRGFDGIFCSVSTSTHGSISFQPAFEWVNNFGDLDGWGTSPSFWQTVQPAQIHGRSKSGFCGRGSAGIWCSQ